MAAPPLPPLVPIIMSNKSDLAHCEKIQEQLSAIGVESEMRICKAQANPSRFLEMLARYEASGRPLVFVLCANKGNHMAGFADHALCSPVIACPPYTETFGGNDVFSAMRNPTGIAPMLVLDPVNAAWACVKIFAMNDAGLKARLQAAHARQASTVHVDDCMLRSTQYVPRIIKALNDTFDASDITLPQGGAKYVGKVRERYNDGNNVVLVTTDRLTGFDRPLCKVPFKGAVLNLVSAWWFEKTRHIMRNHVVAVPHPNVTIGVAVQPFPIEFVVRGYLTGSSGTAIWQHYKSGVREYCGVKLPDGLVRDQKLDFGPIITPTTKSDEHDELISPAEIVQRGLMTQEEWDFCSTKALELFKLGQKVALEHGLLLVDTKMEMGRAADGEIILIDELFTPDSSRYWIASSYEANFQAGKSPENLDKEFLRLWFKDRCDPYKDAVLPTAPADIVAEVSRRYVCLYEIITGQDFDFPLEVKASAVNAKVQEALDRLRV